MKPTHLTSFSQKKKKAKKQEKHVVFICNGIGQTLFSPSSSSTGWSESPPSSRAHPIFRREHPQFHHLRSPCLQCMPCLVTGAACSMGQSTPEPNGVAKSSQGWQGHLTGAARDCSVWATETRSSGDLRTCRSELSPLPTKRSAGPRQGGEGGKSASGLQSAPSQFLKIAAPGSSSPFYDYS